LAGPAIRNSNLEFFLARVEQARCEADAATLDHVRERCQRSEAAWTALADKARRSERLRIEEQERKAATAASPNNENDIQEIRPQNPHAVSARAATDL
jgi:hypothetical protein